MFARLAAALVIVSSTAFAADLPISKDMPYSDARDALETAGWEPVEQGGGAERCSGQAEICATYPEVEGCAGTGVAPCAFVFSQGGKMLTVQTVGESEPVVSGWVGD